MSKGDYSDIVDAISINPQVVAVVTVLMIGSLAWCDAPFAGISVASEQGII